MGIAFRCVLSSGGSGSGGTLTVIGSDVLAGIACTCTDGVTTLTETFPSSAPYNVVFQVPNAGSWTVSVTYHGDTHSETVVISLDQTVDLGIFQLENWLAAGEIAGTYATLDEVLADELAVRKLCLKHNAVDYLANRFVDTNLENIFSNDLFAKWTNNSDYALDKYATVNDLVSLMSVSHKVLKPQVPVMTSNTTPSGEASTNSPYTNFEPYKAFDGDDSTYFATSTLSSGSGDYLEYDFVNIVDIKQFSIKMYNLSATVTAKIQYYDGSAWMDATDNLSISADATMHTFAIDNGVSASKWRIYKVSSTYSGGDRFPIYTLQFYAYEYSTKYNLGEWVLKPQVPTMTSNIAPYGEASASSIWDSNYPAWHVFDGNPSTYWSCGRNDTWGNVYIEYDFVNPVCVKSVRMVTQLSTYDLNRVKTYQLKGYNGSIWENVGGVADRGAADVVETNIAVENTKFYSKYRVVLLSGYAIASVAISEIQFYTYGPKGNVPVMTANNAPYGIADASTAISGYEAYKAFDNNASSFWAANTGANEYLQYNFTNPTCVKRIKLGTSSYPTTLPRNVSLIASNDGFTTSTTLKTWTEDIDVSQEKYIEIENDNYYLWYRLIIVSTVSGNANIATLQFYGRELKVSVPKMTGNTTPYGEADCSTHLILNNVDFAAWRAFDNDTTNYYGWIPTISDTLGVMYVQYKAVNPFRLSRVKVHNMSGHAFKVQIKGSNTGNSDDWTNLSDQLSVPQNTSFTSTYVDFDITSDTSYLYHRVVIVDGDIRGQGNGIELQFYGLDYSEKEFEEGTTKKWLYDHGVELETLTAKTIGNGVARKDIDYLHIEIPSSTNQQATFLATLDLTQYALSRMKLRNGYCSTNGAQCFAPAIYNTANPDVSTSMVGSLRVAPTDGNFENNFGLDISSFNASYTIGFYTSNGSSSPAGRRQDCVEWWLE